MQLSESLKTISISDLSHFKEKKVKLKGWVVSLRSSGKIHFLVLRDGTGQGQCVLNPSFSLPESIELFKQLSQESTVEVEGTVKPWKNSFDIQVKCLKQIQKSEPYPLGKKDHGIDFLMQNRHLWLRSQKPWAVLRIREEITKAIHSFFRQNQFLEIPAPVLTPNACEGSSTLFPVNFFEEEIYLSQSGQFYLESASAAFKKVYCFNPAFRAEKSSTRRHLLEFWMAEAEMAFHHLEECMQWAEKLVVFIVTQVLKHKKEELKILNRNTADLEKISSPFPRLHYREAVEILNKAKNFEEGRDFGGEDETLLSKEFEKPVFIHHFPAQSKAFYMKKDPKETKFSLSFDLLGTEGYGELIGGSEREDQWEVLEAQMKTHGVEKTGLKWYLDLRKYGSFPHSGFGLGVERTVSWICGLSHVRESIPFPRLYGRSFFENK